MMDQSQANAFELNGGEYAISYHETSINGQPILEFSDGRTTRTFRGDEITRTTVGADVLATILTVKTVDTGYCDFILFIPRVKVKNGEPVPVETLGISGDHRTGMLPGDPQLDTFTAVNLSGTASLEES